MPPDNPAYVPFLDSMHLDIQACTDHEKLYKTACSLQRVWIQTSRLFGAGKVNPSHIDYVHSQIEIVYKIRWARIDMERWREEVDRPLWKAQPVPVPVPEMPKGPPPAKSANWRLPGPGGIGNRTSTPSQAKKEHDDRVKADRQ